MDRRPEERSQYWCYLIMFFYQLEDKQLNLVVTADNEESNEEAIKRTCSGFRVDHSTETALVRVQR